MTEQQQENRDAFNEEAIAKICELGFDFHGPHDENLVFSENADQHTPVRFVGIRIEDFPSIEESLLREGEAPKSLESRYGCTTRNGMFEMEVGAPGRPALIFDRVLRPISLDSKSECSNHLTGFSMGGPSGEGSMRRIHVTNSDRSICVELSDASPFGSLFSRGLLGPPRTVTRNVVTLKVCVPGLSFHSEIEKIGISIADAFLYELAVRNGVTFLPRYRRLGPPVKRPQYRMDAPLRFPVTKIEPEIAHLFQSAISDFTNHLTSFLYYYQILEFYFPYAVRKTAIRRVRAELNDPMFTNQDSELLKIVNIAESTARSSELDQISTLIEEWVRSEKLSEYFAQPELGKHFASSGPIKGVGEINHRSEKSGSLASQVSNRIYKLRNRIVHAKDDPKYADTKVLLSSSREAQFMGPDVDLAKLLAQEVILTAQMQA
ncbi:hypothetical protein ACIG56_28350 [Nocardia fusca]|uniref:hypothetical protein n=1 Tax=Nocardia fusca TaxID=941183 RepID=UPI0037CBC857